MKILIADDHPMFRLAVKQILSETFPAAEIGEARDAREIAAQVARQDWDLLVLDITMPGRSGLEVLTDFRKTRPRMPVLVLTSVDEEKVAVRVLKAGAAGYLPKECAADDLVLAVQQVLAGGKYVTSGAAERLIADLQAGEDGQEPHERLSDREFHVLRALAAGRSVTQVAQGLTVSVKTISTYRTRVLEKLCLKTNADITRYALDHRLIE